MRRVPIALLFCLLAGAASASNLVLGGGFDGGPDLAQWSNVGSHAMVASEDALGDPNSGSLELTHSSAAVSGVLIYQCVPVTAGETYTYGAQAKLGSQQVAVGDMRIQLSWWASSNCLSNSIGLAFPTIQSGPTGDWESLQESGVAPQTAVAARIDLSMWKLQGTAQDSLAGLFDNAFVEVPCVRDSECDDTIFCNGYERCVNSICTPQQSCDEQDPTLECSEAEQACLLRWNIDFQGDENHGGVFGQTNPIDHTETGVLWNVFEVQALNSSTASDSVVDPTSLELLSTGATPTSTEMSIDGELFGWSGHSSSTSLFGDYWILNEWAGVDSTPIDWQLSIPKDRFYDLTFFSNDDGDANRWITFDLDSGGNVVQTNADPPKTLRSWSLPNGTLLGTATGRLGGEGNWSGLEIASVPERRFLVDFQGDSDHAGLFSQTDPILFSDTEVWNAFEVQAFNSDTASDSETNAQRALLDQHGGDPGMALAFIGDVMGWSGWSGSDPLTGDYLLLVNAFGVNTDKVDWQVTGLEPNMLYRLTFWPASDGYATRAVKFDIGQDTVTINNESGMATLDAMTNGSGQITGSASNAGTFEGNWAALEFTLLPEPSLALQNVAALLTLVGCAGWSRLGRRRPEPGAPSRRLGIPRKRRFH